MELGRERTAPHGKHFKPDVGVKITRIIADNLKGLLGYPTCKLFGFSKVIVKIGHGKIC